MNENKDDAEKLMPAKKRGRKPRSKLASAEPEPKKSRLKSITITATGKRKRSIARAYISKGKGTILINNTNIELIEPKELRSIIMEPFAVSPTAAQIQNQIDIKINVFGGGLSSQAQASRNSISKAIIKFVNNDSINNEFSNYRYMVVDDPRRVESKKFKGPKARARFQTSYR